AAIMMPQSLTDAPAFRWSKRRQTTLERTVGTGARIELATRREGGDFTQGPPPQREECRGDNGSVLRLPPLRNENHQIRAENSACHSCRSVSDHAAVVPGEVPARAIAGRLVPTGHRDAALQVIRHEDRRRGAEPLQGIRTLGADPGVERLV